MPQNSNQDAPFPAHYNHHLLNWRKSKLGLTIRRIARLLGLNHRTVNEVFQGRAKQKSVYPVARFMELDWSLVHDLYLPESHYHLAVRGGINQGAHPIAPIEQASNSSQSVNG